MKNPTKEKSYAEYQELMRELDRPRPYRALREETIRGLNTLMANGDSRELLKTLRRRLLDEQSFQENPSLAFITARNILEIE